MKPEEGAYTPLKTWPRRAFSHEIIQILVYSLPRQFEESSYSRRMPNTRFNDLRQFCLQNFGSARGEHDLLRRRSPTLPRAVASRFFSAARIGFKTSRIGE